MFSVHGSVGEVAIAEGGSGEGSKSVACEGVELATWTTPLPG